MSASLLLLCIRFFTGMLCVLNLAWIAYRCTYSLDHALSMSCSLSGLVFILSKQHAALESTEGKRIDNSSDTKYSISDAIFRKQLQALNWAILLNKALAFHQIQANMYYKDKMDKKKITRRSCSTDSQSESAYKMRKWSSWSGASMTPDFIPPPSSPFLPRK